MSITNLKELDAECNKKLVAFADHEYPTDTVFHYTSYAGLKGILETKSLWLTNYVHLNDPSEIRYALAQIEPLYRTAISSSTNHSEFWREFFEIFISSFKKYCNYYVLSFCLKKDYLPAWRLYGNDAQGFAIGFRKDFFQPRVACFHKSERRFSTQKIHYTVSDGFQEYITDILRLTEECLKTNQSHLDRNFLIEVSAILGSYIIPILGKIKHPAYREEVEYRIAHIEPYEQNHLLTGNFFCQNSNENPFIKSILSTSISFKKEDITEIWVGSRCTFEHAVTEITRILINGGYPTNKIKIIQSEIPYKNSNFGL